MSLALTDAAAARRPNRHASSGRLRFVGAAPLAALLLQCAVAQTATSAVAGGDAVTAAADKASADVLEASLRSLLRLPADLAIDAGLRTDAEAMARDHVERMKTAFQRWVVEARRNSDAAAIRSRIDLALNARFMNEVALWRLASPGVDYDAAVLTALLWPGGCPAVSGLPLFARWMRWVQQVPPAQRGVVMAGERELLARWDTQRERVPARPSPSFEEQEDAAIARMIDGDWQPEVAMPPVVAANALTRRRAPMGDLIACGTHQWWLRQATERASPSSAQALIGWRYATMPTALGWHAAMGGPKDGPADDYPRLAKLYGVSGRVVVEVKVDPAGAIASTRVVSRDVLVEGVRDARPVAFEDVFDASSLAKVREPAIVARMKAEAGPTGKIISVPFNWRLE